MAATTRSTARALSLQARVAPTQIPTDKSLEPTTHVEDESIIVVGIKHKNHILHKYESEFGTNTPHSIVTRKKGKHSIDSIDTSPIRMKPSIKKYYRVQELTLYNVITTVI